MSTTQEDIKRWLDEGHEQKADYMIVACDTFDYDDYPIYCSKSNFWKEYNAHNGQNMQIIMEVYDLHMSDEEQLNTPRCHNMPKR